MKGNNRYLRIIIGSLDIGGTEQHLAHILPALVLKGWKIRLLTLKSGGILEDFMQNQGIEVISSSPFNVFKKCPRLLKRFIKLIISFKFLFNDFRRYPSQLTHFFLPEAYILGMMSALCAFTPAPKIMSRRSLNTYQAKYPGLTWVEKKLHTRTTAIISNSLAVFNQLQKLEDVPTQKLKLIYNGINLKPFSSPLNQQNVLQALGISDSAFIMIMVANLIPYKGHGDLLDALSLITHQLPLHWRLLCVGNPGKTSAGLQQQAKELGLEDHIIWLGLRRDVPNLLRISHMGILCSHQEGFANSILEGMAASLPMIVTNVGGNAEAVIHNKTGIVVPPHSPPALAKAILKLALNPALAKAFGQAGRIRVQKSFTLESCIEAYDQLYKGINRCAA
jgi:glycosyltransferase involved in cell wall biosynthesis